MMHMTKRHELFSCRRAKLLLLLLLFSGICAGCLDKDPLESRVDKLVRNLGNEDQNIGYASAYALIDIGEPSVDPLIKALKDNNPQVRSLAAFSLGRIREPRASKPLIKTLEDSEPEVRMNSAEALGNLGDTEAVEPLLRLLEDEDDRVIISSVVALGKLNVSESVDPFIELLDHDNNEVRSNAIFALGTIGDPKSAVPLIDLLGDEELGGPAADAVGNFGDKKAVEKLLGSLDSRDPTVRINSIYALRGIRDPTSVLPLIAMLEDRDPEVRRVAASALGAFGQEEAALSEQPLIKALADSEEGVRIAAVHALGRIGGKEAVPPLINLLQPEDSALSEASADPDKSFGDVGSVRLADWRVKRDIVQALVEIGDPEAVRPLILLVGDEHYMVRKSAAEGLGTLGDGRAVEPLLKALETEREEEVRFAQIRALGELGGPEAVEGLRRISTDMEEYKHVRIAAEEALEKIEGGEEVNASSTS